MNELVSIVVPIYNAEEYLEKGIQSIISQTYANIEIIMVDDGSRDGSGSICEKYLETDSRIKVIHKENGGVSSARNTALQIAQGKYICFIDADDVVDSRFIEKMVSAIETDTSELAICGYKVVAIRDTVRWMERTSTNNLSNEPELFWEILDNCLLNPLWNKLFIREKISSFQEGIAMGEDMLFVLEYLTSIQSVSIIPDVLYHYIKRIDSATTRFRNNALKNVLYLSSKRRKFVDTYFVNHNLSDRLLAKDKTEIQGVFASVINGKMSKKEAVEVLEEWNKLPEYVNFYNKNSLSNVTKESSQKLYWKLYFSTLPKRIVRILKTRI